MTKNLNANDQTEQIKKLIDYLVKNFFDASSPNSKIGGLIAVSSVAIALDKDAKHYLEEIVKPVFSCTYDCHRDVRYRSLESLYNIVKCVRESILKYLDEIFDIIIRLGEDSDVSIREASLLMDRLLKDIVMVHKSVEVPQFNTTSFISVIRERIYALSSNTRKLILSWINFLNSLPDVDLLIYIEDILDGLLKIACDNNNDIRQTAENILEDFFQNIKSDINSVEFRPLIKIILIHIQTDSQSVQSISLKWLDQFIQVSKENDILYNSAHILAVILPCLSYGFEENEENDNKDNYIIKTNNELAKSINENLMNLITKTNLTNENTAAEMLKQAGQNEIADEPFQISKILLVLLNELELGSKTLTPTKIAILEWIYQIYDHLTIEIDEELENKLVNILLNTLCDSSDNVILLDLKAFCKIIFNDQENERINYRKLIKPLLDLFHTNLKLLEERGSFIIRQLCDTVDAQKFYITISQILLEYDKKFICSMVYILNTILLTTKELGTIRKKLNNMMMSNDPSADNAYRLFNFLYETWCYSSVSVISLCFLTKRYKLASRLILYFGKIDINIDILLEIDQLIQMLESPIFTCKFIIIITIISLYFLFIR